MHREGMIAWLSLWLAWHLTGLEGELHLDGLQLIHERGR